MYRVRAIVFNSLVPVFQLRKFLSFSASLCAAMFLSALASPASAAPAAGYWWNSSQPGHGYVIEVQGTSMFFAAFLYDTSGRATWVASNGTMASGTQYSGSLVAYSGGQTLTGAYQPSTQGPAVGTVSLSFSDSTHATLVWPDGTLAIQRFDFGPGGSEATEPATNPQTGYWWNPAEGGRGFTIEIQGGTMYLAGYMYDGNGNPIWYLASGPMSGTGSTQLFQGDWTQYANGQTLTGGFQSAQLINADVGSVTVQFTDVSDAILTLPNGRQIPLTRFQFGNSITPPVQNVAPIIVDLGPQGNSANIAFVSVTVCAPGTSNCQTIDHIQVDTGSSGLRIISSVLNSSVSGALTQQKTAGGQALVECTQFVDGYVWGSVKLADFTIAGETVKSLPMQVIDDPAYPNVPNSCSDTGSDEGTVALFGANGIIGVGVFQADCGSACVTQAIPGTYYACPGNVCSATAAPLSLQVQNPVGLFASDNNGVLIQLPSIPASGQATASGSLIFGIGTQSNNALGSATVLTVDPDTGYISATYNGRVYTDSFIDSGSTWFFLPDNVTTLCPRNFSPYFCPPSPVVLSPVLKGLNNASAVATFTVGNAETLFNSNPNFAAFDDIALENGDQDSFDLGLTFFYGRNMFSAIENKSTPGGTGPYFAF
jgi:hypothetical protein